MNRRSLVSIGAVVLVALIAVAWLLWPEPPATGAGAKLAMSDGATDFPRPTLPTPVERGATEPVAPADEPAVPDAPVSPAATADPGPLHQIDVGVIQPDGEPLAPWLRAELPELNRLHAVGTSEPLGERLPDSIAPFYSWMGLGAFDRPRMGNANPAPTVPGFIGTLTLPHAMPVCINLAVGPAVLAVQRLGPDDGTALFVVDPVAVTNLAGSLRLLVLSAETRQPVVGAAIEVGMAANLHPGGENGRSDDLGQCELHDLAPGRTQLWVSAPGFEERGFDVAIPSGDTLDFGTVELQPATSISGRVLFPTGEAPSRPYVTVFLDDAGLTSPLLSFPFTTTKGDEDGWFTVEGLGRRRYALVVITRLPEDDSYSGLREALVIADTTAGPVGDLVVTVEPAPAVNFLNPAGREGVSIHVRNEAAPFVDWWPDVPYLRSPGDMKVSLLPGTYVIEYGVPGQRTQTRPLVVATEPLTVDLSR